MPKIIPNVKETIIFQGRKTLLENGYNSFNMREIAKNSGIGVGTLYNYFSNKDELIIEIFNDDWNLVLKLADAQIERECSLKIKIHDIYIYMHNFLEKYIDAFIEMAYSRNKKQCSHNSIMTPLYSSVEKILLYHKSIGDIKMILSLDKMSHFIISNLVMLCKDKALTFDEMYSCFNL